MPLAVTVSFPGFRTSIVLLAVLWMMMISSPVFGAENRPAHTKPPITSAAEIDYPPFSIVGENGEADGFAVELLRAALAAMGREVTFRTGPWAEVRGWLERGDIDALPLVGRTPEREALFDFTVPYMSIHGAIVVRADETGIRNFSDLRGRQVAVMKGDNAEEFLRREPRDFEIRTTPTFEVAFQELAEGRHDAVVTQRLVALRLIQKTGLTGLKVIDKPIEGFRQDFCFAVHEGDRDTLALLNEGLAIVVADGTHRHLHAKWFAAMQLPTDRPIVVGGDRNFPPFEFLDERGRPAGYNVDLTRAIALEMGLNVEIRLGRWPERMEALKTGKIDVMQGMFHSSARNLNFDFTQAHTVSHNVAVVRKGEGPAPERVDALGGKRIVVQRGDILHDYALENGLEEQVAVVDDLETALRELSEGRHDCALVSRVTALYLIEKHGWTNLVLGKKPLLSSAYCYAAAKGQKALLAQFSEGLKVLEKTGEHHRIYEKWLGVYKEEPLSLIRALWYSSMVLIPLTLLLLGFFLWSWFLRKEVAGRTAELAAVSVRHQAILAAVPDIIMEMDVHKIYTWANPAGIDFFGEDVIGKQAVAYFAGEQDTYDNVQPLFDGHENMIYVESWQRRRDGEKRLLAWWCRVRKDQKGNAIGALSTARDITAQKQTEEALRQSEEKYHDMILNLMAGFYCVTPDGILLDYNKEFVSILNLDPEKDYTGLSMTNFWWNLEDRQAYLEALEKTGFIKNYEIRLKDAHGKSLVARANVRMVTTEHGGPVRIEGSFLDITQQKNAEAEHEKLQSQLIQAQKMESVGRLAGGVAHDFNNMLSVIIGFTELALEKTRTQDPLHEDLTEVLSASQRSADITRQLLAFARQQTIDPQAIDLNETVEGMLKMLRRLIGENIDLSWQPGPGAMPVFMDPSQLDQLLANLCVNARDAIGNVGRLTIETGHVRFDTDYCADHPGFVPGDFILLAISDDGCGMDKETRDHLFEPFFTTKGVGQGTGLGLSTVFGIVKQNNGFVNVYSEPGTGTIFKIYLPLHAVQEAERKVQKPTDIPTGRGETVLVVEDEAPVLKLARKILASLGYTVLTAASPGKALDLAQMHPGGIHLLITDVVMPAMNGRELAENLQARYPDLKILFMSGYTANVIAHRGVLEEGVNFIQKPFSNRDLAVKVREALNATKLN